MEPEEREQGPNTNCLQGFRCPKCGSYEPFNILCEAQITMCDLGSGDIGDLEWGTQSDCECLKCRYNGTVANFVNG